jgi:thioredoxin 1
MGGLLNEIGPDYAGMVNIFKLDVDENPQITRQYQITSIPTLVLFRNGRGVDRIVGLIALNPLRAALDRLMR